MHNIQRPLAERMRPSHFDHLFGQDKIWGTSGLLRKLVSKDQFHSVIFWGPPGTGKTTTAKLIGTHSKRTLCFLSAVHAGVKDIRSVLERSKAELELGNPQLILFLDEVHRLSKNQQDVLLPGLESGLVKFIGATTENPFFEVNSAIISRSLVFRFEPLDEAAIEKLLYRALDFIGQEGLIKKVAPEVMDFLAKNANGDARRALNLLDALVQTCEHDVCGPEDLERVSGSLSFVYDKKGDNHYDTASALIKSIRASKPDAAVYYLARMLDGGEDPMFIARRLMIAASEDIGNANPHGINIAVSGAQAVHMVGMPEARIILSQVCTFLASSPKSNRAYLAINKAMEMVKNTGNLEIPMFLRNAPNKLMKNFGYGKGYVYAHDNPKASQAQCFVPKEIAHCKFYEPSNSGYEGNFVKKT